MQRIVPLYVDHIGWGCKDIFKSIETIEKLGFIMIDPPPSADIFHMCHFFTDTGRAYVELYGLKEDGSTWIAWDGGEPVHDAKGMNGIYSFVLSTKDADATRKAAMEAGFECTPVSRSPRQNNSYPSIGGSAGKAIFQFQMDTVPFPNAFFAAMEHLDLDYVHYYRDKVHMYHPNGVTGVSCSILYYETPEELLEAQKKLHRLHDAVKPYAEVGYCSEYVKLIDKEGYEEEFGCPVPEMNSPVVAVEFENGDLSYIRKQAEKNAFPYFEKNGKVYVDLREDTSTFLIFK